MKSNTLDNYKIIDIPKIIADDGRGNLSVIERDLIPYEIKRVYYLYDVPSDSRRGGHAHKELQQLLIALSGSFDVVLDDGIKKETITLNRPYTGLYIPSGLWRELENFSSGGVCLSLVSDVYKEEDYIREYSDFLSFKNA
ncbi:MAG: FdtA/QdtA family cupin domain-containing protein [Bacteroidetes bacterium]|nr:FdtA/QdtA family cupin domain-containing protein [Bacteroidota bacterium]